MQIETTLAGRSPAAQAIRYTVRAATVRQDGVATPVHLLAASGRSALAYGTRQLRVGAPVVLTVDAVELAAQVAWSDGRRFRVEVAMDEERAWTVLASAAVRPRAAADNDFGSAVEPGRREHPADHADQAA